MPVGIIYKAYQFGPEYHPKYYHVSTLILKCSVKVYFMDRLKIGVILVIMGVLTFFLSIYILWNVEFLYLVALLMMFSAVVLIGLGSALAKGFDKSIEVELVSCYYCNGTGKIEGVDGPEICPRCGGTGLGRSDD
jgi:hypothetical protein